MPPRELIRGRPWCVLLFAVSLGAGCARPSMPPAIRTGTACVGCGMEVHDLHFACERGSGNAWRVYDAIECLIRDVPAPTIGDTTSAAVAAQDAWLADYDRQTLHRADSMWVVRGSFPSPMGGGFAAFVARAAADSVAAATQGRVERLDAWLIAGPDKAPAEPEEASK